MASASSKNSDLKKILNRLTALDKKVDKGFKAATDDRQGIRNEMQAGVKAATDDRQAIRNEMQAGFKTATDDRQVIRNEMQAGFKAAEEFRRKTDENFTGLYREIPEVGHMAYKKSDEHHNVFLKFQQQALAVQQETLAFQKKSEAFQLQSQDFQNAMRLTVQDISRLLARIEHNQSIIQETFRQLKAENEELKKAKADHEATIKSLEERIAMLEAERI